MNNRYVRDGVITDARAGKHVICATTLHVEYEALFRACLAELDGDEVSRVRRAKGKQAIVLHGGGSIRGAHTASGLRGFPCDVLVVDVPFDSSGANSRAILEVLAGGADLVR